MEPIESIQQAKEAANRQAALARILSALETASRDAALTDEDRKIVRYILADAEGDEWTEGAAQEFAHIFGLN
jgi:hypothetical protein